jgi:ethanolamine ammonia-lyase small subunit
MADLWLRGLTQARVGLGRAGAGLPTAALLEFQLAHARARDAVHAALDAEALAAALGGVVVASAAGDRATYLQRPDLGRRLATGAALVRGDWDLAILVGDGLSATAVAAHAAPVVAALLPLLPGWRIAPPVVACHARVALGDDIALALGARLVLVLIGERPGLSAPDSLGAYLTHAPVRGTPDSLRNCVSNIRPPHGLGHGEAAARIAWLLHEARRRGVTGTALKEAADLVTPGLTRDPAFLE